MATRHRGYSLPVRLASTFSQAKVTFLDEISYTKLTDDNDVIKKEDDKEDKPFRKQSDSKSVTFSILSNDKLDNETEPNNDMPAEEPRQRRTSRHWSSSCSRHRNASSLSVLSNPSSVATDDSGIRSAATFKLTVLKIIFVNILFSLINKAFDFSQAFGLMFGDIEDFAVSEWSVEDLIVHWEERGQYGLLLLVLNWSPAIIAIIHLLAYHRKEYTVEGGSFSSGSKENQEIQRCRRAHQRHQRKKFWLLLVLLLPFFPIMPAASYCFLLWTYGNTRMEPEAFQRREKLALVFTIIMGGFEAPLQLVTTVWLMMKGVIEDRSPLDDSFEVQMSKDMYGNNLTIPNITSISIYFSFCSIIITCILANIPLEYVKFSQHNFFERYNTRFSQILGRIPYFLSTIIFRIISYAMMITFLFYYTAFPVALIFLANVTIGYLVMADEDTLKPLKKIRKEIRRLFKANNQGAKEVCFEAAIWMNSFLGVFIPCCYIQRINDHLIVEIENMEIDAKGQLDSFSRALEEDFAKIERQCASEKFVNGHEVQQSQKTLDQSLEKHHRSYRKRLRQLKKKYGWNSEIDSTKERFEKSHQLVEYENLEADKHLRSKKKIDDIKSQIKQDINQLRQRPSILEQLDSLHNKTQEKIQRRQELFGTSISLLFVVLSACLVNFCPDYKYSVNKLNNFNFNIFVSIAVSLGFITLAFTLLNFDLLRVSKDQPHERLKNEREKRKWSQPIQALLSFLFSLVVFAPILCGGFFASTLGPGESFAIVVSDPGATENRMNISFFKIFPVNAVVSERRTSINRGVVTCKEYLQEESIRSSGPVVVFANLDSKTECSLEEEQIKDPEDILLLAENWNNRSSSPFPDKIQSKQSSVKHFSVRRFKSWEKIPVFSLRQEDVEEFEKTLQNQLSKMRTIEKTNLPSLMRHNSDLFTVDCNESECLDITRSCANDNFNGVFLGFESIARRNVMVSISCRDQGRSCAELKQKKNEQKGLSKCQKTVTPKGHSTKKLALRCIWNKTNEDRALTACGGISENLQNHLHNRCCSQNQTNIFFREGCRQGKGGEKKLMQCDQDWSSWSAWSTTELVKVFTRYRLCYVSPTCSYLETEYANNKNSSSRPRRFRRKQCGVDKNKCQWSI